MGDSLDRATEVYADHAYVGGYSVDDLYGKKKPSSEPSDAGSFSKHGDDPDFVAGYAQSPYTAAYTKKPAAKPSAEDYESSDAPGQGRKPAVYGEYVAESEPRPSHGRRPVEQEDELQDNWRPGQASSKPGYGGESFSDEGSKKHSPAKYGRKPDYGDEGEFASRPSQPGGFGKYGDPEEDAFQKPQPPRHDEFGEEEGFANRPARPGGYGQSGNAEEDAVQNRRPSHHDEFGGGSAGYGEGSEFGLPRPGFNKQEDSDGGYGRSKPTWQADSEGGYGRNKPAWQEDVGDSGYGGRGRHQTDQPHGYEAGHKKHGHRSDEGGDQRPPFYADESENPAGYGRTGHGSEYGSLAAETGGLSLGDDSYSRSKHGEHRTKRDDDSDEEDRHKKHGEHHRDEEDWHQKHRHHKKHDDDDD